MKPDLLFVGGGGAVLCGAVVLALTAFRRDRRSRWWAALLWATLGAGLLVQGFAPHLEIRNRMFVLPPSLLSGTQAIQPDVIVAQARRMHLLSGLLTVGAAVGLAFHYRHSLGRRRYPVNRDPLAS